MKGKSGAQRVNGVPGPGQYDVDFIKTKSRTLTGKFGTMSRGGDHSKSARDMPGPGMYAQNSFIG